MIVPKIFNKKVIISVSIFWFISIVLVFILGFENARKILGFISSIMGLPIAIISLINLMYILDEGKLINRALIEAGRKDQDELEKMKKQMEQCNR